MNAKLVSLGILFLLALPLQAQHKDKVKGNKELKSITEEIKGAFDKIEISDDILVEIQNSSKNSYILSTDENLLEHVKVVVNKGTLHIFTSGKMKESKKLELLLRIKELKSVVVNDHSKLKTAGKLKLEQLFLVLNHNSRAEVDLELEEGLSIVLSKNAGGKLEIKSSKLEVQMKDRSDLKAKIDKCKELKVFLENSAEINLAGNCDKSEFYLKDNSKLSANKLKTRKVKLESRNRSDIYVRATKEIHIDAAGKSKIFVYGNPDIEVTALTDRSKIIKR